MIVDYELSVRVDRMGNSTRINYELTASDPLHTFNKKPYTKVDLDHSSPEELVGDLLKKTTPASVRERDLFSSSLLLQSLGSFLVDRLLPPDLQQDLWNLSRHPGTLLIDTDEPWIPWELLYFRDPRIERKRDESSFLCELFFLTRWLRGKAFQASFPLRSVGLITPRTKDLRDAQQEAADLLELNAHPSSSFVEIAPRTDKLLSALDSGDFDGFHFAGHGRNDLQSADKNLLRLDENEKFFSFQLSRSKRGIRRSRPFVFLNSCSSAVGNRSLEGVGSWAKDFLNAGAGGFMGTLWMIGDAPARAYAKAFYQRFLSGVPVARAAQEARIVLKESPNFGPSWLAYTLFCHPNATYRPNGIEPAGSSSLSGQKTVDTTATQESSLPTGEPSNPKVEAKAEAEPPDSVQDPTVVLTSPRSTPESPTRSDPEERIPKAASEQRIHQAATKPAAKEKETLSKEILHSIDGSELVFIPGGQYPMGDASLNGYSEPQHIATLSPFWIGKFPVTNAQYQRFLAANPSAREPAFWRDSNLAAPSQPVVGVSWLEALAYCDWAQLSLPTEAQWEAAARGPEGRRFPWGHRYPTQKLANFGNKYGQTTAVARFERGRGPFGTYDQAGNVWEWCRDGWSADAYHFRDHAVKNPCFESSGAYCIVRGGSWINSAGDLHAAYRERATAKVRLSSQGFRCVLNIDTTP